MARNRSIVILVLMTFFVISLLTNILGPIIPDIISDFHVSLSAAGFLVFSFFIAYGIMSIPAGFLIERYTEKPVMLLSFLAATLGSTGFALFPRYLAAILSLFVIGASMAVLQVAINPLLRVAGGEENFAIYEVLAQSIFGIASFLSPRIYTWAIRRFGPQQLGSGELDRLLRSMAPPSVPWVSLYWLFAVVSLFMLLLVVTMRFPRVRHTDEERPGTLDTYRRLLARPMVWLYFLAIFSYVGCEQGVANWISQFLHQQHQLDPHTAGAQAVSWFWGMMTAGCFAGMALLRFFDSRRILIGAALGALAAFSLALFGDAHVAVVCFPLVGLFSSVMWPLLISLALNSVSESHGSFTGILATGIMGGALIPFLIGQLSDHLGLRTGMALLYLTYGFILSVGFWSRPLINNVTVSQKKAGPSLVA